MSGRGGGRFGWVVLEAALVVLGLVGAWLLNGWQEARSARAEADEARVAIVEELRENRARLAEARDAHAELARALEPWTRGGAGGEPPVDRIFARGFVRPADVQSVVWETASATGVVSSFDHDELVAWARLHARLERYDEAASDVGNVLYAALFEEGTGGVFRRWRGILPLANALLYQECEIVDRLDAWLAAAGEAVPEESSPGATMCDWMLSSAPRGS